MNLVDAFMRHLPVGRYRFVGGPADGETRSVDLIQRDDGMLAPDVWRIVPQKPLPPRPMLESIPLKETVEVHTYRFVPRAPCPMNMGHYEWIDPKEGRTR